MGEPPLGAEMLGHDSGTFLVVDRSGQVASVGPVIGSLQRFVNSSERQFHACLELFRPAWEARSALSEEAAEQQARQLRVELAALDAAALGSADAWWALVIEQLEQGLV